MKKYIAGVIFLVFSFALIGSISFYTPYLENLELKGYDFMMSTIRGSLPAPEDIVVVAIDETSPRCCINRFGTSACLRWARVPA